MEGLENLANKEYLGRFIAIGLDKSGFNEIIVYGVTGRSPSSQAREIVENKDIKGFALKTNPTDPEALKKGNPALLIYNCIRTAGLSEDRAFIVSNGAQTDLIHKAYEGVTLQHVSPNPLEILARAFARPYEVGLIDVTRYEPDDPNFTPRISGIINPEGAALHIVKQAKLGIPEHKIFGVPLIPGKGKLIATYTGRNVPKGKKLPSFTGEPLNIKLDGSPEELAENFYEALKPRHNVGYPVGSVKPDFRVAVATVFYNREDLPIGKDKAYSYHIINRHERGE